MKKKKILVNILIYVKIVKPVIILKKAARISFVIAVTKKGIIILGNARKILILMSSLGIRMVKCSLLFRNCFE